MTSSGQCRLQVPETYVALEPSSQTLARIGQTNSLFSLSNGAKRLEIGGRGGATRGSSFVTGGLGAIARGSSLVTGGFGGLTRGRSLV